MKPGARIALGVGIGYVLGRTKKMRLALMLAGAGATGKLPAGPQDLLQRGSSALGSSPEITKITESVRGELVHAARAAAVTAVSNRFDTLNDRLQSRAEGDGAQARSDEEAGQPEYEDEYDESREADDYQGTGESDETGYTDTGEGDTDEQDSGAEEEPEAERPAPQRRTTRTPSRPRASRNTKAPADNDAAGTEDAPPKPRKRAAHSNASPSGRAPVRRTGR